MQCKNLQKTNLIKLTCLRALQNRTRANFTPNHAKVFAALAEHSVLGADSISHITGINGSELPAVLQGLVSSGLIAETRSYSMGNTLEALWKLVEGE